MEARAVLRWIGLAVLALVLLLVLSLVVLQASGDRLRGPLTRMASAKLGRPVRLDQLELHLLSAHPRVILIGLRLANPPWAGPGDTARIGRLELDYRYLPLLEGRLVLPYVGIEQSDLDLVRDASQRANWDLQPPQAKPQAKRAPLRLPVLGSLHIGPGRLRVSDAIRKLRFDGTVEAAQGGADQALSLHLGGQGEINGAPFRLTASGDPLIRAEEGKPYSFVANIQAGRTHVDTRITVPHPFDFGRLEIDLKATGDDFADLWYLSGLALPNSKAYVVSGHLARRGNRLALTGFNGRLGNSDLRGSADVDIGGEKPQVSADLRTTRLDIADLAPTLGAQEAKAPSSLTRGPAPGSRQAARQMAPARVAAGATLLPDAPLDLARVRGMNARLRYRADTVNARKLTVRAIELQARLEDGVLTLEPLAADLPSGRVVSSVRIDATHDVPAVSLDTRLAQIGLEQFKMKDSPTPPLSGTLLGRIRLQGKGRSVHEVASTASGTVSMAVPHGEVRQAFAELTGINVAKGLGLLLSRGQQEMPVRCGIADFDASGGVFAVKTLVFDTSTVLITGKGEIDLGNEILDLTLAGDPKKPRLLRLRSPIEIGGTLRKPHPSLDAGKLAAQAGVAAALGTLLTPAAAVLAFIDPGLTHDANCSALLAEARQDGAPVRTAAAPGSNDSGNTGAARR